MTNRIQRCYRVAFVFAALTSLIGQEKAAGQLSPSVPDLNNRSSGPEFKLSARDQLIEMRFTQSGVIVPPDAEEVTPLVDFEAALSELSKTTPMWKARVYFDQEVSEAAERHFTTLLRKYKPEEVLVSKFGIETESRTTIIRPDRQPAKKAYVVEYRGVPVIVSPDDYTTWPPRDYQAHVYRTNSNGQVEKQAVDLLGKWVRSVVTFQPAMGFLAFDEDGIGWNYDGANDSVQLQPFSRIKGTVTSNTNIRTEEGLKGPAGYFIGGRKRVAHAQVHLRWESFPWEPTLTSQPAEFLKQLPPLFAVELTARTDNQGNFNFDKVPRGRIRITAELETELGTSSVVTWLDVPAAKLSPIEAKPTSIVVAIDFMHQPVAGRVDVKDSERRNLVATNRELGFGLDAPIQVVELEPVVIFRSTNLITNTSTMYGGASGFGSGGEEMAGDEDERNDYGMGFPGGMSAGYGAGGYPGAGGGMMSGGGVPTPANAIRKAMAYGRNGGEREKQQPDTFAVVDDEGRFLLPWLAPGKYSVLYTGRYKVRGETVFGGGIRSLGTITRTGYKPVDLGIVGQRMSHGMAGMGLGMDEAGMGMGYVGGASIDDDENEQVDSQESQMKSLIREIAAASNETNRKKLTQQLEKLATAQFDSEQKQKEQLVDTLESRLQAVKKQLKERKAQREALLKKRLSEMLESDVKDH